MSYANLPHLRSNAASIANAATPSVAGGAGAGTGATVAVSGSDEAGVVSITTAGTPATGTLFTLTFATPYSTPPVVSVDAGDSHTATAGLYATVTGTTLTVAYAGTALSAAQSLKVFYSCIGGA